MSRLYRILFPVLSLGVPISLRAQSVTSPSLDLTVGAGSSRGGDYANRLAVGGAAVFVVPSTSTFIVGATIGAQARLGHGDVCVISTHPPPACVPDFPDVAYGAVLFGAQASLPGIQLRAMAGPAYYGMSGGSGLGAQGHVDAAVGFSHVALIGALRGSALRRFNGLSLELGSLEFGLRLR